MPKFCKKFLFIIILANVIFLLNCSFNNVSYPEIQERNYNENYKQIGKVTFQNIGYKGVYRIKLNDEIQEQDVVSFANEITEKCNCNLVISPFPEVKNPDAKLKLIYVKDATDEKMLEISKDDRIKFISQHYSDH